MFDFLFCSVLPVWEECGGGRRVLSVVWPRPPCPSSGSMGSHQHSRENQGVQRNSGKPGRGLIDLVRLSLMCSGPGISGGARNVPPGHRQGIGATVCVTVVLFFTSFLCELKEVFFHLLIAL